MFVQSSERPSGDMSMRAIAAASIRDTAAAKLRRNGAPKWAREIILEICERRGVSAVDLLGKGKSIAVVWARFEAYYALGERVRSCPRIASWFGVCHTTVIWGSARHAAAHGLPPRGVSNIDAKLERGKRAYRAKRAAMGRQLREAR